jgi:hypothetical protein
MTATPLPATTILSVDVGTVKCGWSIIEFTPAAVISQSAWKLKDWGLITRSSDTEAAPRAVSIAMEVTKKVLPVTGPTVVVIEKPSGTVYGGGGNFNRGVGRMSKLQQLFILAGAAAAICEMTPGMTYRFLEPSQWQASKKQRNGMDTKEWSCWKVDYLFKQIFKVQQKIPLLDDHNVCDGINIGVASVNNLLSGKWLPPVIRAAV